MAFAVRLVIGHGRELTDMELCEDGTLRYVNEARGERAVRRTLRVGPLVLAEARRLVRASGVCDLDDRRWPAPARDSSRTELTVVDGTTDARLVAATPASLADVAHAADAEGLREFHFLCADVRTLILALIAAHTRVRPVPT
jgi:hypothetical protein